MIDYLQIYEQVLTEASKQQLRQQFKNIDEDVFNKIFEADPYDGKYAQWLLKIYEMGGLPLEDLYKATEYLTIYHKVKNKLDPKYKNIHQSIKKQVQYVDSFDGKTKYKYEKIPVFKSLQDLFKIIKPYKEEGADLSNKEKLKKENLVYEDEKWEVYIPRTYEASCQLGSGTEWCTATGKTRKHYDEYTMKGTFFIFINKQNKKEKYQLHFKDKQFMDAEDVSIDMQEFVIKNVNTIFNIKEIFIEAEARDQITEIIQNEIVSFLENASNSTLKKCLEIFRKYYADELPILLHHDAFFITGNEIYSYKDNLLHGYVSSENKNFTSFLLKNDNILKEFFRSVSHSYSILSTIYQSEKLIEKINRDYPNFIKKLSAYFQNIAYQQPIGILDDLERYLKFVKILAPSLNFPFYKNGLIFTKKTIYQLKKFILLNAAEDLHTLEQIFLTKLLPILKPSEDFPISLKKIDGVYLLKFKEANVFTENHTDLLVDYNGKLYGASVNLNPLAVKKYDDPNELGTLKKPIAILNSKKIEK